MLTKNVGLSEQSSELLKSIEQEIKKFDSQYVLVDTLGKLPRNKFVTVGKINVNAMIIQAYIEARSQEDNHSEAILALLENSVYAKNKNAQYFIGSMYLDRVNSTDEDKKKGIQALEAALALNHEQAPILLGVEYYFGDRIKPDFDRAFAYLKGPAASGDIMAQGLLGQMYYKGHGVKQDFKMARSYFEKTAKKDQPEALIYLGIIHLLGQDVPVNFTVARQYFERAAAQNNAEAWTYLGRIYYFAQGVEKQLDKAHEYLEKAAKQNNSEAQLLLGFIYYRDEGGLQNFDKAREYLNKAVLGGNNSARVLLGYMCFRGEGGPVDKETAYTHLKVAADQGLTEAQYLTAVLYHGKPNKTRENIQQAIHYYLQAANQGHYKSIFGLIRCYIEAEQIEEAIPWLEYLTQQDNVIARQILNADKLDDNAIAALFAQINKIIADVRVDLNLDSASKLKPTSSDQSQENTVTEPASESTGATSNSFMQTFSLPINDMEMDAEDLIKKQAQLKAKSAERRAQKAAVALQIANNEPIQLKSRNQAIVQQIFAKKTKLNLGDFLKLFADPFFQDSVQVKPTKSGFYIEARLGDALEKTGSHHPHGGKEMNLTFLNDLGNLLRKYKLEDE